MDSTAEVLYQMEQCIPGGLLLLRNRRRPTPYDPIVAVRSPDRSTSRLARAVGISLQLEYFDTAEVYRRP